MKASYRIELPLLRCDLGEVDERDPAVILLEATGKGKTTGQKAREFNHSLNCDRDYWVLRDWMIVRAESQAGYGWECISSYSVSAEAVTKLYAAMSAPYTGER